MTIQEEIGILLRNRGLTLATAESCTGGGIAALVTSVAGSSNYFQGGIVAYQNEVKELLLGVPADLIRQYGVVSEQVVTAMTHGAIRQLHADCAIATSGVAGPGGGTSDTPVGTIWIAATIGGKTITMKQQGDEGREKNIGRAIHNSLLLLRQILPQGEKTSRL